MKEIINFIQTKDLTKSPLFEHLKCSQEQAQMLQYVLHHYLKGRDEVVVADMLLELFSTEEYAYLYHLDRVKHLLELGWLTQQSFQQVKVDDVSLLELLNSSITLSGSFMRLLEEGNVEAELPDIKPYDDHLEYLQDQFDRIELYQKIAQARYDYTDKSLSVDRLRNKIGLLKQRIDERIKVSTKPIAVEDFFNEKALDESEQILFLALLKEEYSAADSSLREMNALIELISFDEYDRIKNRALLEDGAKLINEQIIDYDEILNPFGGISRAFFIVDEVLQSIIHPQKKKKVTKLKLDMLIKEQDTFELIDPKTTLEDVVLNEKTEQTLRDLLKQMDKTVVSRLHQWGIKDKKRGIDARIIFHGVPGTGKTMTALSFAKSLKRQVLSFDCSKILSMYVGESEKNVRNIFDTYKDLAKKTKTEPILLLNEADQFLSSRVSGAGGSAVHMHNQMQNIFLEQIERFDGIMIATTNLLENIDTAFSRRFNYKIEFKRPTATQREKIWTQHLPQNAPYEEGFDVKELAKHELTGGQIALIVKNTAYKVATLEEPIFHLDDFVRELQSEKSGNFDQEKQMGFVH
jgi:AAA+ superfamily predicted ATPase